MRSLPDPLPPLTEWTYLPDAGRFLYRRENRAWEVQPESLKDAYDPPKKSKPKKIRSLIPSARMQERIKEASLGNHYWGGRILNYPLRISLDTLRGFEGQSLLPSGFFSEWTEPCWIYAVETNQNFQHQYPRAMFVPAAVVCLGAGYDVNRGHAVIHVPMHIWGNLPRSQWQNPHGGQVRKVIR